MTCCEWTSKDDVERYEEDSVVKMEELIMKNDMEYKLTMREKKTLINSSQIIMKSLLK